MSYNNNMENNGGYYTERALDEFFPTSTFSPEYFWERDVSASKFAKKYNEIFNDLIPYRTITNMIDVEEYRKMSDSEKREILNYSYDMWSYKEDKTKKSPLEDFVKKLK